MEKVLVIELVIVFPVPSPAEHPTRGVMINPLMIGFPDIRPKVIFKLPPKIRPDAVYAPG